MLGLALRAQAAIARVHPFGACAALGAELMPRVPIEHRARLADDRGLGAAHQLRRRARVAKMPEFGKRTLEWLFERRNVACEYRGIAVEAEENFDRVFAKTVRDGAADKAKLGIGGAFGAGK